MFLVVVATKVIQQSLTELSLLVFRSPPVLAQPAPWRTWLSTIRGEKIADGEQESFADVAALDTMLTLLWGLVA